MLEMTAVRPVTEVSLGYGDVEDFSIPEKAFATWWRTVYTPTSYLGLDRSTLDPTGNAFWKFWKFSDSGVIGSTPGEMDYFFCKHQGDGVCLIDTFLKVTPRSTHVYEFVGLGTIEEVERGEGSLGPIVVVVPQADIGADHISRERLCPSAADGESVCFTTLVMGFVFSGAEKAVLINIKNHIPDSAGGAAFISDLRFYSPDSASRMTPCTLSFGGEFFEDSAMKFDYAKNLWFPEVHDLDPNYFTGGATFILCLPRQSKLDSNWSLETPAVVTYIPGNPYGLTEWKKGKIEWSGKPLELDDGPNPYFAGI